jgi:hypothetical protein
MERRNLDLGIPLTREQWLQVGAAADFLPDDGVLEWTPGEFEVIHVSVRAADAPDGWSDVAPRGPGRANEREVARFVYNEGRPMAQLTSPLQPEPPAVRPSQEAEMDVELERWLRTKWHCLVQAAGLHDNTGAIPNKEPNAVD